MSSSAEHNAQNLLIAHCAKLCTQASQQPPRGDTFGRKQVHNELLDKNERPNHEDP